jgi:bifunctional UDP-N-acetylglucosamine pyrophosphorylase / glucosamine-1-phosphate N-acetyltransferase
VQEGCPQNAKTSGRVGQDPRAPNPNMRYNWGMPRSVRPLSALVLAAGHGTRMRSARPKPLHMLVGRPLVHHVLDALGEVDVARTVVVVGHGSEAVTKKLQEAPGRVPLSFIEQPVQRGTGDAVAVGLTAFPDDDLDPAADGDGDVMVLPGDTPLLRPETISRLVDEHRYAGAACTVLTARFGDPSGYGRVERDRDDRVRRIVEHKDCDADQLAIDEVNTGIYVFRRSLLAPALRRLTPDNAQGELYVTDVVEVLADAGHLVVGVVAEDPDEAHGVNDRVQLAAAEAELRRRINRRWLEAGVTIVDPATTYIDATVELDRDITIWPGSFLHGQTTVGGGSEIGPATQLVDCTVGENAQVVQTVARRATIGDDAVVGPYASLDNGAEVGPGARTGAFYAAEV